ncbi:hypothetical protein BDZ97DRAFT_1671310 [Flammula alnicola]|nr:hypothetical protein BDZ97DRAFT_1671310 [Flammula alnicola]
MTTPGGLGNEQVAVYPLTLFDNMFAGIVISMGWLVEGKVDVSRLEQALDAVAAKWPLLVGRLERNKKMYQLRIPLGSTDPAGYRRFTLTSRMSNNPLSDFVSVPLPLSHKPLPVALFTDAETPRTTEAFIDNVLPITHWHVTYFNASDGSQSYSCIGVTFPHAVFDGLGIASVVHALEAELLGKEWSAPATLHNGLNENPLSILLDKATLERRENWKREEYSAAGLVGFWWILVFAAWSYWQVIWHGAGEKILLIPRQVIDKLVEDARQGVVGEGGDTNTRLSRGDVLAAFLFKTIFCDDRLRPDDMVHMASLASLHWFFDGTLANYSHNCVIPLPYRRYVVQELETSSTSALACELSGTRQNFAMEDALQCYNMMLRGAEDGREFIYFNPNVDEGALLTNVCIANIANINWKGAGAGRTLCRYKINFRKPPLDKLTNDMTAVGYLEDGALLLQVNLIRTRMDRLEGEIRRLMEEAQS